jgi:hypothetical protein
VTGGETPAAGVEVEWNIMYRGKGVHDEHLRFVARGTTAQDALNLLNRDGIIAQLEASGAVAKFAQPTPAQPAQGQVIQQVVTPRPVVAQAPAGPQRTCPNGHVMKFVNAGVSRTTQRAYPAFYVCEAGCVGQNGKKYSENAA